MNANRTTERRTNEQGIALVIVLGFLAIMTIMAVSFTINMRTERLTSRLYLDTVRSRHFVDLALSRALSDLDIEMKSVPPALTVRNFDFYASNGNSSNVTLFTGVVTNFLPSGWSGAIPQSRLVNVPDRFVATNPPIGQYAYLAVNLTGFLDMNHAGLDGSGRSKGRSPGEIRIRPELLTDVDTPSWESTFGQSLSTRWRRIETIAEYLRLASGATIKTNLGSRSFFPASRSLMEVQPDSGINKIYIGGNKAELIQLEANIVEGFAASGLTIAQAQDAYNQLLDFVDPDLIPENVAGLSGEPVPMINEIAASGNLVREVIADPPDTYRFILRDFKVSVELWYPFPIDENNPVSFRVSTNIGISFTPANTANQSLRDLRAELIPNKDGSQPTISPATVTVNRRGFSNAQGGSYVVELTYPEKQFTVTDPVFSNPNVANANIIDLSVQINTLEVLYGDDVVDKVSSPGGFPIRIRQNNNGQGSIACLDPRLNHLSGSTYWRIETIPSLGQINPFTTSYNQGEAIGTDPVMYSRNFPLGQDKPGVGLGSVADLGYLSLGLPWRTIALYDEPAGKFSLNPVLDHFSVNASTGSIHGLVNINSRRRDILASVFLDQPIDAAPENEPTLGRLDVAKAREFADAILGRTATAPFDRLSQIGSLPPLYDFSFNNNLTSDARIESLIRNSVNLFTTRQNLFGIIIQAHTLSKPEPGGQPAVTAVDKALAIVWRDPVAVNGVNETIVRYFAWLNEE